MKEYRPLILSILALGVFGGGIFYLSSRSSGQTANLFENPLDNVAGVAASSSQFSSKVNIAETIARPAPPPPGYVKYENKKYGFYYYHSLESTITEYDEGGGAMTIVQENKEKVRGMQIFIVPYAEETISEERFRRDVPSGVRTNVENTRLGVLQIPTVTFNSYDAALGETREVWFIHNGFLYEVTTFKGVGDWFAPIMQTWRFL